jgi:hypothetical protein
MKTSYKYSIHALRVKIKQNKKLEKGEKIHQKTALWGFTFRFQILWVPGSMNA